MRGVLPIIGDESLHAEPRSVGRSEIEPSVDIATRRNWAYKITAERRAETPARLEVRGREEALTDATRDWLGDNLRRLLPKTIDQISNCVAARRTVEARMGVSNMQLASPEGCPKLFVHRDLG